MMKTLSSAKVSSQPISQDFHKNSPKFPIPPPEEIFSSACSPILDKSLPTNFALCNSPAESTDLDTQASYDFSDLKFEDDRIKFPNFQMRFPKQKTSKTSIFRFGISPLEAIEESSQEEVMFHKPRTKTIHKSHHESPRLIIDGAFTKRPCQKRKILGKALSTIYKSPYSCNLHLSPCCLPALKQGEKTLKAVKSFRNLRTRKSILND
jgi:hypothetical protein